MVHGILQFTPSIAFRYVLHRCESRDIRCRESFSGASGKRRGAGLEGSASGPPAARCFSAFPWRLGRRGWLLCRGLGPARSGAAPPARAGRLAPRGGFPTGSRVNLSRGIDNDPSAGSPTETLLRLLLPLNDKVQWTSRDVAGSGPPTSPRSEHFTGPFNR